MFGFLQSENSKLRDAAKNWFYLGGKVHNYRKDELTDAELGELDRRMNEFRRQLKTKPADAGKLKLAIEEVEGQFYIKRLSGTPGDRMKIEDGKLFVNDKEATGSVAFGRNNGKEAPYDGYFDDIEQTAPGFQGLLRP
ncbi:MAG: hypothetical protein ACI92G_003359 [Candidatus Pelagisphaera sp.]|jgi:hypothetical protein